MTLAEFLDSLQTTWPARAIQGAVQGAMAPGNAFASSWGNPVTTEQMVAPAANLAGLAVGFPGGAGGLGSGLRLKPNTVIPGKNGDIHNFLIGDANGKLAGSAQIRINGDTANIDSIVSRSGDKNVLGTSALRDVLMQFRQLFPQVKTITGLRTSGARGGGRDFFEGKDMTLNLPQ